MNWTRTEYNASTAWFPESVAKQRAVVKDAEVELRAAHTAWRTAQREGAGDGVMAPLGRARDAAIKARETARANLTRIMGYVAQRGDGFAVFKIQNGKLTLIGKHGTLEEAQAAYR